MSSDDAFPDPLLVQALPVLGVEPAHIAEARRALKAQGRVDVDDDAIARVLWIARALPAALDVLSLAEVQAALAPADVEVAASGTGSIVGPGRRDALVAVARLERDEVSPDHGVIVVEILDVRALFEADAGDAPPCCVVTLPFSPLSPSAQAGEVDVDVDADIAVHRFTLGPPT